MTHELWLYLIGQLLGAAGIYTAIRVDLREHKVLIGLLEKQQEKQQEKLENHLENHKCQT